MDPNSLYAHLSYQPKPLQFGTSGRRGNVVDLTQLEVYINALGELEFLQGLPADAGGISRGDQFFFAYDLRPSSTAFVPEQEGRGEIAQAIEQAITDAGMQPVNLGAIPTPALMYYALEHKRGSIMVTGSHIPFERNGFKTNTSIGELRKQHEAPIGVQVEVVRRRVYAQSYANSLFNELGLFKTGSRELPTLNPHGREAYINRYLDFFRGLSLHGSRLFIHQHSAVGRDVLLEIVQRLGADAIAAGRSEHFVPIDTENMEQQQLQVIQDLVANAWLQYGLIDAVISTDGDSDRPLLLGVEKAPGHPLTVPPCRVRFYGGDLVGMVVAQFLQADAVVVPISCNDAIDRGALKDKLEPKTRIGSPYVIEGMEAARNKGRQLVCGWEANGGFLTGSDFSLGNNVLKALPTRDAVLPLLAVLFTRNQRGGSIRDLFDQLPKRFSRAALIKNFPRASSSRIMQHFSPQEMHLGEVRFEKNSVVLIGKDGQSLPAVEREVTRVLDIYNQLEALFTGSLGFGHIARINYVDGIRISFENGDVAHVRPSGNADELRIYAVADSQARADEITIQGVTEPDGILRKMQRAVGA